MNLNQDYISKGKVTSAYAYLPKVMPRPWLSADNPDSVYIMNNPQKKFGVYMNCLICPSVRPSVRIVSGK